MTSVWLVVPFPDGPVSFNEYQPSMPSPTNSKTPQTSLLCIGSSSHGGPGSSLESRSRQLWKSNRQALHGKQSQYGIVWRESFLEIGAMPLSLTWDHIGRNMVLQEHSIEVCCYAVHFSCGANVRARYRFVHEASKRCKLT